MNDLFEAIRDACEAYVDHNDPNTAVRAAIETLEKAGHRIVPVEPTKEILLAMLMSQFANDTAATYAAILNAVPKVSA